MNKFRKYDVTLRRDVQQMVVVRVEAPSPQDAIDSAEAAVTEADWKIEEHIGTHRPKVELASKVDAYKRRLGRTWKRWATRAGKGSPA